MLEIWRPLKFRHSKLLCVLPLYFVRGLSPERAIRAAAAGVSLRKPVPVLHGNKLQRQEWERQGVLVRWLIKKNVTINRCF